MCITIISGHRTTLEIWQMQGRVILLSFDCNLQVVLDGIKCTKFHWHKIEN